MDHDLYSFNSSWGKWLGFVAAIWVQAICGNNYTFSNYSDVLKSLMSLTQLQLNNLSVAKDVGKAFGLLAGLASDQFPPSLLLVIGSVQGFIGYGVQWLVVSQRIRPLPYWQVTIGHTLFFLLPVLEYLIPFPFLVILGNLIHKPTLVRSQTIMFTRVDRESIDRCINLLFHVAL